MKIIRFRVIHPIVRHGRQMGEGVEFWIKKSSSRVHVDRWLAEGKIHEVTEGEDMQTLAKPPKKVAAAVPQRAATTATSSPQNGVTNTSAIEQAQAASKNLEALMEAAMKAAGCVSMAEFKHLPTREQNAYIAQARAGKLSAPAQQEPVVAGVQMLDPETIQRSPFNRDYFDQGKLDELIADVRERGVLQAGIVRPIPPNGKIRYEIIAGERRWLAAKAAGVLYPATIRTADDIETLEIQAVENFQREDLNPMDEALKYEQLREAYEKEGHTKTAALERICDRMNKAKATVYERLSLLKLPSNVRVLVQRGLLPASHAALLTKLNESVTVLRLTDEIVKAKGEEAEGGILSFRATKVLVAYEEKREANLKKYAEKEKEFREKGLRVLGAKENAQHIKSRPGMEHWWLEGEKYIKPDESCYIGNSYQGAYSKVWKKAPAVILGQTPDGRAVSIYLKTEADEAAKANMKSQPGGRSSSGRSQKDIDEDRAHRRRKVEYAQVTGQIVTKVECELDSLQFWQIFAKTLIKRYRSEPITRIAKRRGDIKQAEAYEWVKKQMVNMSVGELRGLCLELLLQDCAPGTYMGDWHVDAKAIADFCKVSLPAWKDEVQTSGKAAS